MTDTTARTISAAQIAELRSLYERTSFSEDASPPKWSDMRIENDGDGP